MTEEERAKQIQTIRRIWNDSMNISPTNSWQEAFQLIKAEASRELGYRICDEDIRDALRLKEVIRGWNEFDRKDTLINMFKQLSEAVRKTYGQNHSILDLLDSIVDPGVTPIGAPGSIQRVAWDIGQQIWFLCAEANRSAQEAARWRAAAEVRGGEWCAQNRSEGRGRCGACAWCCNELKKDIDAWVELERFAREKTARMVQTPDGVKYAHELAKQRLCIVG